MTIINTSPDRPIQLGYEGEDRVTVLRFRYGAGWLENGEGIFHIRVRRHGEHTAYNAALVAGDAENSCLLMTVTDVELSVKGSGEMQVVYSGENFVKKSPIYSYNVSRAVDEVADPPAQDVYTEIIESLSDLQTDVQGLSDAVEDIGDISLLTTTAKTDLVSAINEVNEHGGGGGGSVTVDSELSTTSRNPVQNKVITARINGLDSDVGTLRTSVQSKADTQTVSALSDAIQDLDGDVQGLQTTVQNKADTSTVTALSGTVSALSDAAQQYMEHTEAALDNKADTSAFNDLYGTVTGLQTSKADKSYVDAGLAGKASTATATASSDGLMSAQDKSKLDAVGSVVTASGTAPVITAISGVRYVCGEVATLDFTPCVTGICDVVFTSGSTPTVVTLPNTVKFPDGEFVAEADTAYEINIMDGVYGGGDGMDLMQVRRRMMMQTKKSRLPDGYRELEYITGTGEQYLDTGIRPQVGDALEITFYSNASADDLRPFGAYTPGVALDGYNGMRIITSAFYSVYAYIGGGRKSTVECTADGIWSLNGAVVKSNLPIQTNNNLTISIFKARYRDNKLYGTGEMTLYGFKYYRAGSAIADYVPCEEIATGNIGVYDLVSGAFVGNAGTGTFTT